ncbi:hypothetical protein Mal48_07000 [Thalassoglobus polymorphus]|uniref:Uncharacterized protein n=1 Tax=Thalassoglobus polymorphus TaxID=2527994 RepID=A0A517QIW1_9PLAN|nr:hypothetical protein Mal48_07000 [Thalassoglobus polymorphus]
MPHVPADVNPIILAAKLDGCWIPGRIFGRIKDDCVGPNMRKYFRVRPLYADPPEVRVDCPVFVRDNGANRNIGPIPIP